MWHVVLTVISPIFTFMHLADAFIQSFLFRLYIFNQYVCFLGIEPTTFCAANTMLYHWATGTFICCSFAFDSAQNSLGILRCDCTMICNKINALCIIISDMVMREPPTKTVHKETFPQHKFDFIYIATLYSDSPAPEMKLTVHVDRPESSDATLSPFSRVVTFVSGTFKTTWVDLGWNTHDHELLRRMPRNRDLLSRMS